MRLSLICDQAQQDVIPTEDEVRAWQADPMNYSHQLPLAADDDDHRSDDEIIKAYAQMKF